MQPFLYNGFVVLFVGKTIQEGKRSGDRKSGCFVHTIRNGHTSCLCITALEQPDRAKYVVEGNVVLFVVADRINLVASHANRFRIPVEVHKGTEVKATSIHQFRTKI